MEEWTLDSGQQDAVTTSYLTAKLAAELCHVHHRTIRRAILRGELPATKQAGVFRIDPAALRAWQISRRAESRWQPLVVQSGLDAPGRSELPRPLTSLIGREKEAAHIASLLQRSDVRLLTLTGPGGVGKTRLALRVLADLDIEQHFPDGIWFVALAPLDDPEQVASALVRASGARLGRERTPAEALRAFLQGKRALLVIDNFEHLLSAAPLLSDLLESLPQLTVMTTSRVLLRVSGEHSFSVPPMTLPEKIAGSTLDEIRSTEAVNLYVERAQNVNPAFHLTDSNAAAVSEVCRRLDGLPLAIELAAARSNLLSPQALLSRLDDQLQLLTGGARDAPERLRTMRDAIGWSYELLTKEERATLRRLAVFSGGCTPEAAFQICNTNTEVHGELFAMLASLVDSSLVIAEEWNGGQPRFRLLESVRAFGQERMAALGEEMPVRTAHASYFLDLAEQLSSRLQGQNRHLAVPVFAAEQPNFWTALAWFESQEDLNSLRRMAIALQDYWVTSGDWVEAVHWLERASNSNEALTPDIVRVRDRMGMILVTMGDHARAEPLLLAALNDAIEIGAVKLACDTIGHLCWLRARQGRFADVDAFAAQALALSRRGQELNDECMAYHWAGIAAMGNKDRVAARRLFERVDEIQTQLGTPPNLGSRQLAMLDARDGNFAKASTRLQHVLRSEPLTNRTLAIMVDDFGSLAAMLGQAGRAARLFGACQKFTEAIGLDKFLVDPECVAAAMSSSERALGPEGFQTEMQNGKMLTVDELIVEIEAVLNAATRAGNSSPSFTDAKTREVRHGLTLRELEVLRLVADRYSNPEIADILCVSPRTVQTHVSHVFQKLGVSNRREAEAEAKRLGLT